VSEAFPAALADYLAIRDEQRQQRVLRALNALSPRERQLVREAAVMGYVQGVRAAGVGDVDIPRDAFILHLVVDACFSFDDLYPTIGELGEDTP
jgi:hypothetical protein